MIVPGDRAPLMLGQQTAPAEQVLRTLAAVVDSRRFAPFFHFVSTCVELLLQHRLPSVERVVDYVELLRKSPLLGAAMTIPPPKRVIIWTTPFKQLSKDPALLVRVNGQLRQLDQVRDDPQLPPSFLRRVSTAIADADTKYAAMWKLYVFISDGLFYSGSLARLLPGHACGRDIQEHRKHLHQAQMLLVAAFHTAYELYEDSSRLGSARPSLDKSLTAEDAEEFGRLLDRCVWRIREPQQRDAGDFSAVDVAHYLHGDIDRCRDVRYRFGALPEAAGRLDDGPSVSAEERRCVDLLGQSLKNLTFEEQLEVRHRMRRYGARLQENAQAARGEERYDARSLRDVYWEDLPRDPAWPLFD
jgi:hypothetical protein